ncbi:hypothetical protein B0H10DRAFT_1939515 [Mycena sp. CBHHK59/15]|nr:hypothetical protein B0H10DRAFT_1939515 [Mycena sp. CBHHK59/15]
MQREAQIRACGTYAAVVRAPPIHLHHMCALFLVSKYWKGETHGHIGMPWGGGGGATSVAAAGVLLLAPCSRHHKWSWVEEGRHSEVLGSVDDMDTAGEVSGREREHWLLRHGRWQQGAEAALIGCAGCAQDIAGVAVQETSGRWEQTRLWLQMDMGLEITDLPKRGLQFKINQVATNEILHAMTWDMGHFKCHSGRHAFWTGPRMVLPPSKFLYCSHITRTRKTLHTPSSLHSTAQMNLSNS